MTKRLNVKLLLRVALVLIPLSTAVHLVHGFQIRRQARNYLRDGDRAVAARDFEQAVRSLGRYLALRPNDVTAQAGYALALERLADTPAARWRAYRLLEKVALRAPDHVEVHERLGHLAVQLGRFTDAARYLEPLRRAAVDRAELEQTLAWCYLGAGDRTQAAQCFSNAIRHGPERVANYVQLAALLLRQDQAGSARQVMDDMVASNRQSSAAYAARGRYRQHVGRLEDAAADVARAGELAPHDPNILLQAAELARVRDRLAEARQHLNSGLSGLTAQPGDARFPLALARLEQDTGHRAETVAALRKWMEGDKPERPEVLALLGELLLESGEPTEAVAVAVRLRRIVGANSPWIAYLEAWAAIRGGEWVTAARRLEGLTLPVDGPPGWPARIQLGLGRCYEACGDAGRQLGACRQAVALDSSLRTASFALARALAAAGRLDEAAAEWERLMRRPEAPKAGWGEWAEVAVRRNPARLWREAERVLGEAAKAGTDPVRLALLRAELLTARARPDEARALLEREAKGHPRRLELTAALADLAVRRGEYGAALRLLAAARRSAPGADGVEWRLAQVRCVRAAPPTLAGAETALEEAARAAERLPPADQGRLFHALVGALQQRGDSVNAFQLCRRWCALVPHDLTARLVLFDLAAAADADPAMGQVVADLRRIEGDGGVRWRCGEVMRLLAAIGRTPRAAHQAEVAAARRLLAEADRLQPGWGRVAFLAARLDEADGRPDSALDKYLRAFDQGERPEEMIERLAQLLCERQRFIEADRIVRTYQQQAAPAAPEGAAHVPVLSSSLARLGCAAALHLRDHSRAVELARLAVPENARDYRDHLWLARVLTEAGRDTEAGKVLERLTENSGAIADTWVALLRHLVRAGQWEDVRDVLPRARRRLTAGIEPQWVGLARCYEVAAQTEQAERAYRRALKDAPGDSLVLRDLAYFYLFHDRPGEALPPLRALIGSPSALVEHVAWARRMLATLPFQIAALSPITGESRAVSEEMGLKLLESNRRGPSKSVADQRAQALVLAADPRRAPEALRLFGETLSRQALTPDEQFWLAQLADLGGDSSRADGLMLSLLAGHGHNARYLAGQVRRLLARGDRAGARRWLRHLQKVEPDTPRSRALRDTLRD